MIKQKEMVMIGNIRVGGEGGMIAVDRWVSQLIRIIPSLVCEDNYNHLWAFIIIIDTKITEIICDKQKINHLYLLLFLHYSG